MFNIIGSYYFREEKDLQTRQWKHYKKLQHLIFLKMFKQKKSSVFKIGKFFLAKIQRPSFIEKSENLRERGLLLTIFSRIFMHIQNKSHGHSVLQQNLTTERLQN